MNDRAGGYLWKAALLMVFLGAFAVMAVVAYNLLEVPSIDPLYQMPPPGGKDPSLEVTNSEAPKPNIIIINCDDLGYGDLGCYGTRSIRTPSIDGLASEGVRFTSFYACNSVCTPSRAGLLTGRYPQRSGLTWILFPAGETTKERVRRNFGQMVGDLGLVDLGTVSGTSGLSRSELTLAEALKMAGYRTGMVGKWHLGDFSRDTDLNPVRHGFDTYFGVPYSNDMIPFPLYRNEDLLEAHVEDPSRLTALYTKEAVSFIEESRGGPFFLYLAHTYPHQPLYASERFRGVSRGGIYGDVVEEIDWSVGEIVGCLRRNDLDRRTLIVFTSDNGPWFEGDAGHHRGRKGQSYEGGYRVPMIARYPGVIRAGTVCREPAMNIDLFPTSLALAGLEPPRDRVIDGRDILALMTGEADRTPHEALYFYHMDELEAVRAGKWKYIRNIHHYVFPVPTDKETTKLGKLGGGWLGRWPLLYDLELDPSESYNLVDTHPEVGQRLLRRMEGLEAELRENPRGWIEE